MRNVSNMLTLFNLKSCWMWNPNHVQPLQPAREVNLQTKMITALK